MRLCAAQVEAVLGKAPLLIGPSHARRLSGPKLNRFRSTERLSDMGLRGFWRFAAERFFVLEEAMREASVSRCLHLENDNLLYPPAAKAVDWISNTFGDQVAVCPVTDVEDTASVMYVGSLNALERFNDGLLRLVQMNPRQLLTEHGGEMANEMRMLHLLRTQGLATALPTTIEAAVAQSSPVVFDSASFGQFVDGAPNSPGRPWAGDHHFAGRELRAGRYRIIWDAQQRTPSVIRHVDGVELPLANLHIHSKRLDRWVIEATPPPQRPDPNLPQRFFAGIHRRTGVAWRRARRATTLHRSKG
jgi:hypothetical protein